jgi:DNA-binding NarL/FixJ family response regulator
LEVNPAFQIVDSNRNPQRLDQADVWIVTDAMTSSEIRREIASVQATLSLLVLGEGENTQVNLNEMPVRGWGYLPVDATVDEIYAAVQAIHAGLIVYYPDLVNVPAARRLSGPVADVEPLIEPLTEREIEVLQWVTQGLSNKQIAGKLYISEHTVKFHVSSIYGKLGATNRAEAVRLGVQQGLVAL